MGVIQSFERRLQGAVGNTFARLFGGKVQPAEVADALQQEAPSTSSIRGIAPSPRTLSGTSRADRPSGSGCRRSECRLGVVGHDPGVSGRAGMADLRRCCRQPRTVRVPAHRAVPRQLDRRSRRRSTFTAAPGFRTEGRSGTHDPAARRRRPIRSTPGSAAERPGSTGALRPTTGRPGPAVRSARVRPVRTTRSGRIPTRWLPAGRLPARIWSAAAQPRLSPAAVRRARLRPAGLGSAGPALGAAVRPAATAAGLPAAAAALPAGPAAGMGTAGLRTAAGRSVRADSSTRHRTTARTTACRQQAPAGNHRDPVDRRRVGPQLPVAARLQRHRPRAGRRVPAGRTRRCPAGTSISTSTARPRCCTISVRPTAPRSTAHPSRPGNSRTVT